MTTPQVTIEQLEQHLSKAEQQLQIVITAINAGMEIDGKLHVMHAAALVMACRNELRKKNRGRLLAPDRRSGVLLALHEQLVSASLPGILNEPTLFD